MDRLDRLVVSHLVRPVQPYRLVHGGDHTERERKLWKSVLLGMKTPLAVAHYLCAWSVDSFEVVEVNPVIDEYNRTADLAVELRCSAFGKKILGWQLGELLPPAP